MQRNMGRRTLLQQSDQYQGNNPNFEILGHDGIKVANFCPLPNKEDEIHNILQEYNNLKLRLKTLENLLSAKNVKLPS